MRDAAQRQHAAVRDAARDRTGRRAARALRDPPPLKLATSAARVLRGSRRSARARAPGAAATRERRAPRRRRTGGLASWPREATSNGVWGGKIMWGHVEDLVARARELPGLRRRRSGRGAARAAGRSRARVRHPPRQGRRRRCRCGARSRPRAGAPARRRAPIPWPTTSRRSTISCHSSKPTSGPGSDWFARTGAQADPRDLRPVGCRAGPHGRGRAARAGTSRQRRGGPAPHASARRPLGGLDRALPRTSGGEPRERDGSTRLTASRARGRSRVRDPRGRRRAGQAGAPVQRRQGLDRAAARGGEGVRARCRCRSR